MKYLRWGVGFVNIYHTIQQNPQYRTSWNWPKTSSIPEGGGGRYSFVRLFANSVISQRIEDYCSEKRGEEEKRAYLQQQLELFKQAVKCL